MQSYALDARLDRADLPIPRTPRAAQSSKPTEATNEPLCAARAWGSFLYEAGRIASEAAGAVVSKVIHVPESDVRFWG